MKATLIALALGIVTGCSTEPQPQNDREAVAGQAGFSEIDQNEAAEEELTYQKVTLEICDNEGSHCQQQVYDADECLSSPEIY